MGDDIPSQNIWMCDDEIVDYDNLELDYSDDIFWEHQWVRNLEEGLEASGWEQNESNTNTT